MLSSSRSDQIASVMPANSFAPPHILDKPANGKLIRQIARRATISVALIIVSLTAWYFGLELPSQRKAKAEAKLRAANALTIPDLNLDLVWIPTGSFLMGTPEQRTVVKWYYTVREKLTKKPNPEADTEDERPVTWVTLTQPFWIGRTAVTQGQYEAVMQVNPSHFTMAGKDAPVESVSWADANAFCQKLTERERASDSIPTDFVFTLPTEAQREYSCRAGTPVEYSGNLEAIAWYRSNSDQMTHPVGMKQPNVWGLYDMQGNVNEWCLDWYSRNLKGGDLIDPAGPLSGDYRVIRGGCWVSDQGVWKSDTRSGGYPALRSNHVGFRVVLFKGTVTGRSAVVESAVQMPK